MFTSYKWHNQLLLCEQHFYQLSFLSTFYVWINLSSLKKNLLQIKYIFHTLWNTHDQRHYKTWLFYLLLYAQFCSNTVFFTKLLNLAVVFVQSCFSRVNIVYRAQISYMWSSIFVCLLHILHAKHVINVSFYFLVSHNQIVPTFEYDKFVIQFIIIYS